MTLDKASLRAVIERLEKADGPSYQLDCRVAHAVGYWSDDVISKIIDHDDQFVVWFKKGKPEQPLPDNFTASIDAAIALTERMLPGWVMTGESWPNGWARCTLIECHEEKDGWQHSSDELVIGGTHKTEPLARLLALFKALLAKEEA